MMLFPVLQIFGSIEAPPGVDQFVNATPDGNGQGLIVFASNMIKVVFIIAGLFALFNVISAGYLFLNSQGNPKEIEKATGALTYSLLGLAIMVGSFTIVSIVSFLLFGNASFILNPALPTAGP